MERATRRSLIILGIVAVVVLALFIVGVVYGTDDGGRGSGCSSRQRETWRARLLGAEPVAPGQLGGCTTVPGVFTIPVACELRIAAADARSRRLVLVPVDPVELGRTMDAGGRPIAMRAKLEPGKDTQLYIAKGGETLSLRCLAGLTCRARLE